MGTIVDTSKSVVLLLWIMASPCEILWPKVILYGDSITQKAFSYDGCWGQELANALIRKCDVINRGFGGYNTRWQKILLPRIIPAREAEHIHLVIIFLGANDSTAPGHYNAVPLDEFQQNLVSILDYLMACGIKRDHILLVDNPVVDVNKVEDLEEMDGDLSIIMSNPRTWERSEKYAHACVEVAKKWRVGYVELFDKMAAQPNWKDMLIDGVHFTHLGAEFMFKLIWPWVDERTKDLPTLLPEAPAINTDDPEKSLTQGGKP